MNHLLYVTILFIILSSCSRENEALLDKIFPCENEFKRYLKPEKSIIEFETHEIEFYNGSKSSEKYLIMPMAIRLFEFYEYGYLILNKETDETSLLEIPQYYAGFPLSSPLLMQIHKDNLYLAIREQSNSWRLRVINLTTLQEREISLDYEGNKIQEILQVEIFKDDIYVLSDYREFSGVTRVSVNDDSTIEYRKYNDGHKDIGFKVMQIENDPPFYLRIAEENNGNTLVQKFNLFSHQEEFTFKFKEGLDNSYTFNFDNVHIHTDGIMYINLFVNKGVVIDVKNNSILKENDYHMEVINDKYAISYTKDNLNSTRNQWIMTKGGFNKLFKADWELSFISYFSLGEKHLLIDKYSEVNVLNLETGCVEYQVNVSSSNVIFRIISYKKSEDEFVTINGTALKLFKI